MTTALYISTYILLSFESGQQGQTGHLKSAIRNKRNTLTQRVWCEVAKVISLKDGRLQCYYA